MLRLAPTEYRKFFQNDQMIATFGGAEANVAVCLSNFGFSTEFVSVLPDNEIGKAAQCELRYFGVGTKNLKFKDGRMGLYFLERGVSQRPSKVIYDRAFSSFSQSEKCDYDWDTIFEDADWFHFSGITPALSENLVEICLVACKKAKEMGITISCDLNYRKKLWSPEKAQKTMTNLMQYVDVCFTNEEDADKVLGIQASDTNIEKGNLNKDSYLSVAKQICNRFGCQYVSISLRKSYSASYNGWSVMLYDSKLRQAYFSKEYDIQIVDRVGAGDSFAAGIIYCLINQMEGWRIVEFAAAASCLKHSIEGDYNRISIQDISNLIENGGSGRVVR